MKKRLLTLLLALLAALAAASCASDPTLTLYAVNAGKADAFVFVCDRQVLVVDTGTKKSYPNLKATLELAGVKRVDHLILTHGHKDHMGGVEQLAEDFEIGTIYVNALDTATYNDAERALIASCAKTGKTLSKGDTLTAGSVKVEVLAPGRAYSDEEDDNNNSLVLRLTHGQTVYLMMADATRTIEDALIDEGALLKADFLKVGRHGQADASGELFLQMVSPQMAYIPGPANEAENSAQARLAAFGTAVYASGGEAACVCFTDAGDGAVRLADAQ